MSLYRQVDAEKKAANRAVHSETEPKKDYSLKEGQTISINIGNVGAKRSNRPRPAASSSSSSSSSGSPGLVPLIPPPPSAAQVRQQQQQQHQQQHHNQNNLF